MHTILQSTLALFTRSPTARISQQYSDNYSVILVIIIVFKIRSTHIKITILAVSLPTLCHQLWTATTCNTKSLPQLWHQTIFTSALYTTAWQLKARSIIDEYGHKHFYKKDITLCRVHSVHTNLLLVSLDPVSPSFPDRLTTYPTTATIMHPPCFPPRLKFHSQGLNAPPLLSPYSRYLHITLYRSDPSPLPTPVCSSSPRQILEFLWSPL